MDQSEAHKKGLKLHYINQDIKNYVFTAVSGMLVCQK